MDIIRSDSCISIDQLRLILKSEFRPSAEQFEHLQSCRECQSVLDRLTDSVVLSPYQRASHTELSEPSFLAHPLRKGDIGSIDGFAIDEVIDAGGMSIVLRGRDLQLDRLIAVKVLKNQTSTSAYSRFEAEVKALAKLAHDHIVPVYSVGKTIDHRPYLVMPFIRGTTLATLLKRGPLEPKLSAFYAEQVANGLEFAHRAGLIHRDIKPANILIDRSDGKAKLIDFGLVREQAGQRITQADILCGTPEYMSVEQANNDTTLDHRSDVYSLGITLYECMTGTTPFRGKPLEVLHQHMHSEPMAPSNLNRSIPKDLETICLKAISRDRSHRYQTALEFAEDLARFRAGASIVARPRSAMEKFLGVCNRNRALAFSLVLLFLALSTGTIVSTMLMLRSERNSTRANKLAIELQISRNRMRNAVQKFQSKVFSEESLHWQMSSEFRAEMFSNVIEYLDEFAIVPPASSDASQRMDSDDLANSYLEIANAALQVGQCNEAGTASEHCLNRIGWSAIASETAAQTMQRCQALRYLILANAQNSEKDLTTLQDYANQCLNAVRLARQQSPDDIEGKVADSETLIAVWQIGLSSELDGMPSVEKLRGLRTNLEELRGQVLNNGKSNNRHLLLARIDRSLVFAGWMLVLRSDDELVVKPIFGAIEKEIGDYREQLRVGKKPLLNSDRLRGLHRCLQGKWYQERKDFSNAIEAYKAAIIKHTEAVEHQPQNRIWRAELAAIQSQLAECYQATEEWRLARETTNASILNFVRILETDPKDMALRATIIESLIRFGELSVRIGDSRGAYRGFNTAAMDCNLVLVEPTLVDWGIRTKAWAIVKSKQALDEFESSSERATLERLTDFWINEHRGVLPGFEEAWFRKMIDERQLPDRSTVPSNIQQLQFQRHQKLSWSTAVPFVIY